MNQKYIIISPDVLFGGYSVMEDGQELAFASRFKTGELGVAHDIIVI